MTKPLMASPLKIMVDRKVLVSLYGGDKLRSPASKKPLLGDEVLTGECTPQ